MRSNMAAPLLLLSLTAPVLAGPVAPQLITIDFDATTLTNGNQLPAFTFSFYFSYSLDGSNYPVPFVFKMDNSSIDPHTGLPFATAPFQMVSTPVLSNPDQASWIFDPIQSSLQLSSTDALFTIHYDPPMWDVFWVLDPPLPIPWTPTPVPIVPRDNLGGKGKGSASGKVSISPEPASYLLFGAGLGLLNLLRRRTN